MKAKATIATDLSWTVTAGVTIHDCMQLPAPKPVPGPNLEPPVPMDWSGGKLGGRHSLAATVTHRGAALVQITHDCGVFIPHVTLLPLPDPLTPIRIALSSRKIAFAAQRIRAKLRPLAIVSLTAPMLACGTLPMAVGVNLTHGLASVDLGFTASDLAAGWAEVLATMAASHFLSAEEGDHPLMAVAKEVLKRALPPAVGLGRLILTDDPVQISWVENYWFFKIDLVIERNAAGEYDRHNYSAWDTWLVGEDDPNAPRLDWKTLSVYTPTDAEPGGDPDQEPPL